MKVALYARVSKEDGQTPENQLDIIRSLAERRGYEVVAEYVDKASGKDANRPQFAAMMEAACRHDFDAIMAVRMDRIMRSLLHLHEVLQRLDLYGVKLLLTDMELDFTTPAGRLTINVLGAVAQWEREIISTRTKEGLQRRRANGVKLGAVRRVDIPIVDIARMRMQDPPIGWQRISKEVGIPKTTILDRREEIDKAMDLIRQRSSNGGVVADGSNEEGSG